MLGYPGETVPFDFCKLLFYKYLEKLAGLGLEPLMSAADSSRTFDLRCEAREKMLAFLLENHPGSLPRLRAEFAGEDPRPGMPLAHARSGQG